MTRVESLGKRTVDLYGSKNPHRGDWADWLYENHVRVVADYAKNLSARFGAREELCIAAALLHDIADAVMPREDPQHEERSTAIAMQLLEESGFSEDEMKIIVDDVIRFHSCHGSDAPQSLVGRVMATADALGHLKTDFYDHALQAFQKKATPEEIKNWALPKIERDYRKKICFDDVRKEVATDYERVKSLFDHLR